MTSVFFQFSYVGPSGLSLLKADIFLVTAVIVLSIHLFRDSCSFRRAMQHSIEGCMMFSVKDINKKLSELKPARDAHSCHITNIEH